MKDIKLVYPGLDTDGFGFYVGNYEPLVKSMGYEVLLDTHQKDYQGDSLYLLRDLENAHMINGRIYGARFGFLIFGWGSCSGCDALQACQSYEDIERLRQGLHTSIIWHDSAEHFAQWVKERDWTTQHYYWDTDSHLQEFFAGIKQIFTDLADWTPPSCVEQDKDDEYLDDRIEIQRIQDELDED